MKNIKSILCISLIGSFVYVYGMEEQKRFGGLLKWIDNGALIIAGGAFGWSIKSLCESNFTNPWAWTGVITTFTFLSSRLGYKQGESDAHKKWATSLSQRIENLNKLRVYKEETLEDHMQTLNTIENKFKQDNPDVITTYKDFCTTGKMLHARPC